MAHEIDEEFRIKGSPSASLVFMHGTKGPAKEAVKETLFVCSVHHPAREVGQHGGATSTCSIWRNCGESELSWQPLAEGMHGML